MFLILRYHQSNKETTTARYVNPDVDENDWRLFRKLFPVWQENYMNSVIDRYIKLLQGPEKGIEKFHTLEKMMDREYYKACFEVEMSRSKLWMNIARLLSDGVITEEDIAPFSSSIKEKVSFVMKDLGNIREK